MDLVRSISYPANTLNPAVHRQAEASVYVEQRLADQRQIAERRIESGDQQGVNARKRQSIIIEGETRSAGATAIIIQPKIQQPRDLKGLSQPPLGKSSSAFLAQQLAQFSDTEEMSIESPVHREASDAYGNTLGLTSTILGFQGFRERTI